jgi:ferredoxin
MPIVNFVNEKKQIQVPEGANLRKEAMKAGIQVYPGIHKYPFLHCPGIAQCATCRVLITKGMENTSPMGILEKLNFRIGPALFAYIGNEECMRLACQTKVRGDIEVVTKPKFNLTGESFFS